MSKVWDSDFAELLDSAARLQELVPDAILVGGSAEVVHAGHRISFDHDHVIADLRTRFDLVLDALEREGDWVSNRMVPGKIILGELGGIETGVRQMIRTRPLEFEERLLASGRTLRLPTFDETFRIKAFLIVKRNQTRDYLDVAALADAIGVAAAADVLVYMDDYYEARDPEEGTVAAQVADQLADPRPADRTTTLRLRNYKGLAPKWQDWSRVRAVCQAIAAAMLDVR